MHDVRRLVEGRLLVAVLDGLDEMPRALLCDALQSLDRAAGGGLRMVLTCRSAEFEQAVAEVGVLSHAEDDHHGGAGARRLFAGW